MARDRAGGTAAWAAGSCVHRRGCNPPPPQRVGIELAPHSGNLGHFCPVAVMVGRFYPLAVMVGRFYPLAVMVGRFCPLAVMVGTFCPVAVMVGRFCPVAARVQKGAVRVRGYVADVQPRDVLTRPGRSPDIVYRYGSHADQIIDVHLPPRPLDSTARAPVVVLVHGGFWRQEYDRRHTRPMAEALSGAGYVVATPEYRRTGGDGGYPMTLDDVAAATSAASEVESIAPGRADLADVTLVGHSAGGHLAMWVALRPGSPTVRKVVALAPVADLVEGYERDLDDGAVRALMGGSPSDLPDAYAAANPAAMLPSSVAVTVVHGTLDDRVPISMSRSLWGVELVELPGVEHFALIDPVSPAFGAVLNAVR